MFRDREPHARRRQVSSAPAAGLLPRTPTPGLASPPHRGASRPQVIQDGSRGGPTGPSTARRETGWARGMTEAPSTRPILKSRRGRRIDFRDPPPGRVNETTAAKGEGPRRGPARGRRDRSSYPTRASPRTRRRRRYRGWKSPPPSATSSRCDASQRLRRHPPTCGGLERCTFAGSASGRTRPASRS